MGVRGLTTYIAKQSDKYLEDHLLHDCYVVVDGNNLAAHLYKWHSKCYDCFGGDYDLYKKTITDFVQKLLKCNVTPLFIFDGSYEYKKLRTIYSRVRDRVRSARKLNVYTENSVNLFPLFMRELFTETVLQLGCKAVRCDFEADYEMACIARTLKCPVLSYDSDFFIFDVLYIPFSTINMNARRIRRKSGPSHAIECKIYKIDNFLNSLGGLDKANLPLLAALLGNDYIKQSTFNNFYRQLKLTKRKSMQNDQHRKIETVIKWLRNETYESAAKKILGRVKQFKRKRLADQIKLITDGYVCCESKMLKYLDIEPPEEALTIEPKSMEIDISAIPEECEGDASSDEDDSKSDVSGPNIDIDEDVAETEDIADTEDSLVEYFPSWFLNEYRRCNFPAWFADLGVRNRYFFIPQIENNDAVHSHHISLNLLSALFKIVTGGKQASLVYVARCDKDNIKNYDLENTELSLLTLEEIENTSKESRMELLHKILGLKTKTEDILSKFPTDWHVFILSIIYWAQHSDVKVSHNHIYTLLLSAITMKVVDAKIGYIRTLKQLGKHENASSSSKNSTTDGITEKECINFMREMIPHFYMDEKLCRNPRLFDVHIVDAFARFQSCLFYIKYLNKVLRNPFEDFLVSDFYNGTFIYSVFANLMKRADAMAYIKIIFSNVPGILSYFTTTADVLIKNLDVVEGNSVVKRRRKRKNRNKSEEGDDSKVVCVEEDESEGGIDENNQYSILNFI